MLSDMENIEEIREQQRVAERAAAAPYVDYPPTPFWYMPAMGLWAFAATVLFTRPHTSTAVRIVGELVLLAAVLVLVWWQRKVRGVWPTGKAPQEIRRVMVNFVVGVLVVIGIVLGARALTNAWIAAAVAFVIVTVGVAWYEQAYARASERVRERLA
jgi:hypothetical protein